MRQGTTARLKQVLLGIALFASGASAQAPAGSIAEPEGWNGPRGNAAGTFRSAAMPILGDIEEAWKFPLPGVAAGAPVLWDGVAYMLCSTAKGRTLLAIDLLTGERRAQRTLRAGPSMPPVLASGLAIVKQSDSQLVAYRLRRGSFSQRWKPVFRKATRLSDPLVVGNEVYVVVDGSRLVRLQPGKAKPVWTGTTNYDFVGTPAAYGSHVFVLHHAAQSGYETSLQLVTFQRANGSQSGSVNVAWYQNGQIPSDTRGAAISVMAGQVYVTSTAPLKSSVGGLSYASLPCTVGAARVRFERRVGLMEIIAPPSWNPSGTLCLVSEKGKQSWNVHEKDKGWGLTSSEHQPGLFRHRVPATVFGRVAYFGTWAADLVTDDVLWRLPVKQPRFVAVPADRLVLIVDGNTLRAFREKGSGGRVASRREGGAPATRAVGRDGELVEGELTVSFGDGKLHRGKKDYDLDEFYVVEDADGKLIWATDFAGRIRGYEFLAGAQLRQVLARLTKEAAKAKDPVARGYLNAAKAARLEVKDAERLEKKVRAAERKPKPAKPENRKKWETAAAHARAILPVLLAERARTELAKGDANTGLRILRESLRRDEKCAPALALLKTRAPKEFTLGPPRFWLDMHLDLLASGAKTASDDELELKRARYHWRKDLYGLEAGPILLITPMKDTRVAGRCLAFGRMTCEVLSTIFATDTPHKRRHAPMLIHLFESKKEYEAKSGVYGKFEDPEFLKWTAGHYSASDSVSRFFWFKDPSVERRVAATCVHELTHHWLREQSPMYASSQIRRRPTAPGHWIIEGFAAFIEEGIYDIDHGTWSLFNPRSRSLDFARAAARSNNLIDWTRLYAITAKEFKVLDNKGKFPVVSRWMLGRRLVAERSMFYRQAAATCAFLYHADDGKYRDQLLAFVVNCYMGKAEKLTPEAAFGMTAPELGKRVLAFADQVAEGWQPTKR